MSVLPEHSCQQGANDPYFAAREKDWQVLQRNYIGNMALSTLKASAVAQSIKCVRIIHLATRDNALAKTLHSTRLKTSLQLKDVDYHTTYGRS
ncbi:hypothetical protein THAOC_10449 [Thalassiosira oceanica]|uniref:Uncharacterized protein n=1 Tax=Thalassiosira oceanica TaxID=159749 RepID=K0SSJ1_THAOC|nr:hypothetical protein THAOC_10449 [Thalassiosira oceanica]|eukprot:EJK68375.1 hypothetical protein THAOC_10449 [Thalassiosira oceanica]